jgi:glutamine synthetase
LTAQRWCSATSSIITTTQKSRTPPATTGDVYEDAYATDIPQTLRAATDSLRHSSFLRQALGDDVVDHYTRAAEWEQEEFDRVVTDWKIARGFERA